MVWDEIENKLLLLPMHGKRVSHFFSTFYWKKLCVRSKHGNWTMRNKYTTPGTFTNTVNWVTGLLSHVKNEQYWGLKNLLWTLTKRKKNLYIYPIHAAPVGQEVFLFYRKSPCFLLTFTCSLKIRTSLKLRREESTPLIPPPTAQKCNSFFLQDGKSERERRKYHWYFFYKHDILCTMHIIQDQWSGTK